LDARVENPADASLNELFGRLVDDGKTLVRSEVGLYKEVARYRAGKVKGGAAAIGAAVAFGLMALLALTMGLVLGLATLAGPLGAGLIVAGVAGLVAFLLVRYGAGKMKALAGDPEEKAAIAAGERQA